MGEPYEVSFRLCRRRSSVPRARALLHAALGDWTVSRALETAELILSELVTNALRVRAPKDRQVGVRIARRVEDGLLRLEVSDAGAGTPEVRMPGEDETQGRGLLLVEALAHRWSVEKRPGGLGKSVWAELKAPDSGQPDTEDDAPTPVPTARVPETRTSGGARTGQHRTR